MQSNIYFYAWNRLDLQFHYSSEILFKDINIFALTVLMKKEVNTFRGLLARTNIQCLNEFHSLSILINIPYLLNSQNAGQNKIRVSIV